MAPKKTPAQKRRQTEDTRDEGDFTSGQSSQSNKSQSEVVEVLQTTIDKHLKPVENAKGENDTRFERLEKALEALTSKIGALASKDYLDTQFQKMVTSELLTVKLKELEAEVKSQVKNEIENVYTQMEDIKSEVKTSQFVVDTLRNQVSDMETSVDNIKTVQERLTEENKKLRQQLQEREIRLSSHADAINTLEQYTRKNSIRIYGLTDSKASETPEETTESVVNLVTAKLGISISALDIDIAHRMGKFSDDANRPVICKFVSRMTKQNVIKARRKLKGSLIVIREDLTVQNAKLLESTSNNEYVQNAWSDDGKIIALLTNGKKIVVDRLTCIRQPD